MTAKPKIQILVDILEEHLEELAILWMRRAEAAQSAGYVSRDIGELDERLEAHVQGLLLAGDAASPCIGAALGGDEPWDAFAAAYLLLRQDGNQSVAEAVKALRESESKVISGVRDAFCAADIHRAEQELEAIFTAGVQPAAVAAAFALAHHGRLDARDNRLEMLFGHEDPDIRRDAWRIAALIGT